MGAEILSLSWEQIESEQIDKVWNDVKKCQHITVKSVLLNSLIEAVAKRPEYDGEDLLEMLTAYLPSTEESADVNASVVWKVGLHALERWLAEQ
jgi:hypothetical protein